MNEHIPEHLRDKILSNEKLCRNKNIKLSITKKDLRRKTVIKKTERNKFCKKGMICGKNHISFDPDFRKKQSVIMKEVYRKFDPFYMVDGIIYEDIESESINTNSGVLSEKELTFLE